MCACVLDEVNSCVLECMNSCLMCVCMIACAYVWCHIDL
jgi:hypothetical protein